MPAMPNDRMGPAVIGVGRPHDAAIAIAVGDRRRVIGRGASAAPAIGPVVPVVGGVRATVLTVPVVAGPAVIAIARTPGVGRGSKPADDRARDQATREARAPAAPTSSPMGFGRRCRGYRGETKSATISADIASFFIEKPFTLLGVNGKNRQWFLLAPTASGQWIARRRGSVA